MSEGACGNWLRSDGAWNGDRCGGELAISLLGRVTMIPPVRPRWLEKHDVIAMGLLVAIPLAALSSAALAGYPLLTGDDVTQSYPLSVLSGEFLAHGHLPVYDPYLWSGAPLLAGANAHALLPTTVLFAFLPHLAAWVVSEALTLGAGAIGGFLLLRRDGCRPLAAALGGATFGLGGFVSSQIVHIDFVAASAALVWCLVALDGMVRGEPHRRAPWALVLAIAVACVGLSGSPDIVIDTVVALGAYGGHLLIAGRGRRLACLGWAAAGSLAGLAVSAVQWLPAAEFVAVSERAHAGYAFAASGSVSPAELLISVVPHVLGGGPIGLEAYTGPYSLAELDAYCGVLSLVAVVSLVSRWRSPQARRWRVWYLIGAVGLLLALGSNTPLEHALVHLPLVGEQRLPSRALILFSLASSMLLGHWIEEQLASERGELRPGEIAGGMVAPLAVLGLVSATALTGKPYGGLLDAVAGSGWSLGATAPYLLVAAVIALAAGAIVLLGHCWSARRLAGAIAALVIADLLVFTADQSSLAPIYARALEAGSSLETQLAARLAGGGRFVIVDPARSDGIALDQVGASDFNVLSSLSSAQGYGSLTWGPYASATGTHSQDDLDPAALATGALDSLDVRVLLTVPDELSLARAQDEAPGSGVGTSPGLGAPAVAGVEPVRSRVELRPGQVASRWFGRALVLRSATLELSSPPAAPAALAAFGRDVRLVSEVGGRRVETEPSGVISEPDTGTVVVTFKVPRLSVGLEVANRLEVPVRLASITVTAVSGASYRLDGPLAAYLTAPHWVAAGTIGPFAVFSDTEARGSFSPPGRAGEQSGGLRVRVVRSSTWTPTETVVVTATAATTIVRSVADIPGWSASGYHDGRARAIALHRDGLVQSFSVPEGTTVVTFSYEAPGLGAGLLAAALGIVAMLLFALAGLGRPLRRSRRRHPVRSGKSQGRRKARQRRSGAFTSRL
ncbi:MAG: hypothetical protein ACLP36_05755 [Acidimicrobiales bacterium]